MKQITVNRDNKPIYNINFVDSYSYITDMLNNSKFVNRKICIVSDSNVAGIYLSKLVEAAERANIKKCISFVFDAGEENKNTDIIFSLVEKLIVNKFDRNDCLLALGGGVTGDMTGFAAAIYLRGISFYQIPTSLLAMVDSSIGGKTGVDFNGYKNMVGAFHMPMEVCININSLKSLPEREYISGFAEIIKHAIIADNKYFELLNDNFSEALNMKEDIIEDIIYRSCRIKQNVVENDPTEKGIRAYLNFGHTIGHAIEKYMDFKLLHGECVALGMIAASFISYKRNLISEDEYKAIRSITAQYGLPVSFKDILKYSDKEIKANEIVSYTKSDKKADGTAIKFVLIDSIGNAFIDKTVTDEEMISAVIELGGING